MLIQQEPIAYSSRFAHYSHHFAHIFLSRIDMCCTIYICKYCNCALWIGFSRENTIKLQQLIELYMRIAVGILPCLKCTIRCGIVCPTFKNNAFPVRNMQCIGRVPIVCVLLLWEKCVVLCMELGTKWEDELQFGVGRILKWGYGGMI